MRYKNRHAFQEYSSAHFICCCCLLMATLSPAFSQDQKQKLLMVCGDSKLLMVDYTNSRDTIPAVSWVWDAHLASDLPDDYRLKKFNSIDDCKAIKDGKQILISSSSGAVAVLRERDRKVLFYAGVPNAHSIEILPDNRLVAAASTHEAGNKIMLFDMDNSAGPVFTDSLYSAHGLVYDTKRKSLFALGYEVLREYKLGDNDSLLLKEEWQIPGISGHDLYLSPTGNQLFVTEHSGSWIFDLEEHTFKKIEGFPDGENIKSLGQDDSGQYIFTVPEESWWTHHVSFFGPGRSLAFPDIKVYKARWFTD